ncbi:NHL domain-containing thioredoxin family protein [Tenggerimyces flavus]|uniref:NHL domain-containing thioredoxin family protein n=1 Tax=Tenggerimyces flavus TaxID=1708749 RepID=A0ABV7YGC7_9ACTN|nr:NHL domain-containing thioredoxin family protein [Tenggerimyces flavus]MBM7784192.1 thiol-disulfide isomerase/thioredoxin [Tenggerimyces flavus]
MQPRARVRAPELVGRGGWLNTGGEQLRLADFRGRFVLLDFWTFCCINCLHVLEELRALEVRYEDVLVVVGVHSPKFTHEADPVALRAAIERYAVRHPVLDDPTLTTWQAYAARAWPTLTLIDPEGYVVAQFSGEGHTHALESLLGELVPAHDARSTLHRASSPYVAPPPPDTALRFPAKAIRLPNGEVVVADAGNHSLAILGADLTTVVRRIGSGERGLLDGTAAEAGFREPNGLCLLPKDVARKVGYDLVVADTVNHALRGVRLPSGDVRTLAGSGQQWMPGDEDTTLSSPWDVAWFQGKVWIAMAGIHQLWTYDPISREISPVAGTRNEGLVDGPLAQAWFAQPSGLSVSPDGSRLWIADAETSALRYVEGDEVTTAVGTGLFDFGLRDGPAEQALLQHPLGVCALPDGTVAVTDTYNGALRRYDPVTRELSTIALGLSEPSGAYVADDQLVVVESAAHALARIALDAPSVKVPEFEHQTKRPTTELAAGEVELVVVFEPPPGEKLDDSEGPATRLFVSATPPALLREGAGKGTELTRRLVLDPHVGDGVLHVAANAASCDIDAEHPTCHIHQQDWGVPVRLSANGDSTLTLVLSGAVEAD